MIRFSLVISAIEVVLTFGAALVIAMIDHSEPGLTEDDLRAVDLSCEKFTASAYQQFDVRYFDTRATLSASKQSVYVSHRFNLTPSDFDLKREKERTLVDRRDSGEGVITDDPFEGERAYVLRHRGADAVRAELVRVRGDEMILVRVTRAGVTGAAGKTEVANCERNARVIQDYLLQRWRWRE